MLNTFGLIINSEIINPVQADTTNCRQNYQRSSSPRQTYGRLLISSVITVPVYEAEAVGITPATIVAIDTGFVKFSAYRSYLSQASC